MSKKPYIIENVKLHKHKQVTEHKQTNATSGSIIYLLFTWSKKYS